MKKINIILGKVETARGKILAFVAYPALQEANGLLIQAEEKLKLLGGQNDLENTYKFRAECENDVYLLLGKITYQTVTINSSTGLPDVEVQITTGLDLKQLVTEINTIEDSHVMLETIQPLALYTGIRG